MAREVTMTALRDDIKQAMQEADDADGTEETEAAAASDDTTQASEGGLTGGDADDKGTESEAGDGTDLEAPDEYFGYKFPEGMEPKERLELIEEFRKRDDHIGKLLREKATEDQSSESSSGEEAEEGPQAVSDEDILKVLGLDPENNPFDEETAKVVVPLVRMQLEQQSVLETLVEAQQLAELDSSWRKSLSGLEREFGSLPSGVDHDRVMEYAAENEVLNPVDAYWRIMGPGRAEVAKALEERSAKTEKAREGKRSAATTRPRTSSADDEALPDGQTTREATREVTRKLLTELGQSLEY